MIRRRRFAQVVSTQLDLFGQEHAELLRECEAAEAAYDAADRDEAEERYGDYAELLEAAAEPLAELRDAYAATLDDDAAEDYAAVFDRAAGRRFPRLRPHLT